MTTPRALITKVMAELWRKILTIMAMISPNRPIIMKLPMPVRSRLVTVP